MARRNPKTFTLTFEIFRRGESLTISTYLPVRAPPLGSFRMRLDSVLEPIAVITPHLTRGRRRLLKAMVEREQDEEDTLTPKGLIADMEAIVLAVYAASGDRFGVPTRDLMTKIVKPVMSIAWCAQAVAEDIDYSDNTISVALIGNKFISMLIDAAQGAAQPAKPPALPDSPSASPTS